MPAFAAWAAVALARFPVEAHETASNPKAPAMVMATETTRSLNEFDGFTESSLIHSRSMPSRSPSRSSRQQTLVSPQCGRPRLDVLSEVHPVQGLQVVRWLERAEAFLADHERFDGVPGVALPALERTGVADLERTHEVTAPSDAEETRRAYFASAPLTYRGAGAFHAARRLAKSASSTSTSMRRFSASISMRSPSRRSAIGPPTSASGETWPTENPFVAPENRPSVISATSLPRPAPATAAVTASISGMPGDPFGPSYLMAMTSPALILPDVTASNASCSESNGRATPVNMRLAAPAIFITLPSGASDPYRIAVPPVGWMGLPTACTTVPSGGGGAASERFSETVLPVTVSASP